MKRLILQTILPLVILAGVLIYLGDFLSLQYRIPNREPYGSVMVRQMYAVRLKSKDTEYMPQPPQAQECVNSMFPHFGDQPCWYLRRHPRQQININSGAPSLPSF
jgi:hypothetical protein